MMKDKCLKYGTTINSYNEEDSGIESCLCRKCWFDWRMFHELHRKEIEKKYSIGKNEHHASWSVFIGELPNLWMSDREKVEFT